MQNRSKNIIKGNYYLKRYICFLCLWLICFSGFAQYDSSKNRTKSFITGEDAAAIQITIDIDDPNNVTAHWTGQTLEITSGSHTMTATVSGNTLDGTTAEDSEGNLYVIDGFGNVEYIGKHIPDPGDYNDNLYLYDKSLDTVKVTFSNADEWAYDLWLDIYEGKNHIESEYEKSAGKYVDWKLVPVGKPGKVKVTIINSKIDPTKLIFRTPAGTEYFAENTQDGLFVSVISSEHGDMQELYALYPKSATDATLEAVGKLDIASYSTLNMEVDLVRTGTTKPTIDPTLESKLNDIFKPYGISYKINIINDFDDNTWDLNQDGKLQIAGSGAFSQYTTEMTALNNLYRTKNPNLAGNRQVLFAVNAADEANTNLAGDMPLASQFGYLICENITVDNIARTAAHEIAHGLFQLRHIWEYDLDKGSTDNLMDYSTGTRLIKFQWDEMFDKKDIMFLEFQGEDVGKENEIAELKWTQFANKTNENSRCIFIAPSGLPITTIGVISECFVPFSEGSFAIIDNMRVPSEEATNKQNPIIINVKLGAIYGFVEDNIKYYAIFSEESFKGFYCRETGKYYEDEKTLTIPKGSTESVFYWTGAKVYNKNDDWVGTNSCIDKMICSYDLTLNKPKYKAAGPILSDPLCRISGNCNPPIEKTVLESKWIDYTFADYDVYYRDLDNHRSYFKYDMKGETVFVYCEFNPISKQNNYFYNDGNCWIPFTMPDLTDNSLKNLFDFFSSGEVLNQIGGCLPIIGDIGSFFYYITQNDSKNAAMCAVFVLVPFEKIIESFVEVTVKVYKKTARSFNCVKTFIIDKKAYESIAAVSKEGSKLNPAKYSECVDASLEIVNSAKADKLQLKQINQNITDHEKLSTILNDVKNFNEDHKKIFFDEVANVEKTYENVIDIVYKTKIKEFASNLEKNGFKILSDKLLDPTFLSFPDKLKLVDDLTQFTGAISTFNSNNSELLNSWKTLLDAGEDLATRTNYQKLQDIFDYQKLKNLNSEQLSLEIKNAGGYENWKNAKNAALLEETISKYKNLSSKLEQIGTDKSTFLSDFNNISDNVLKQLDDKTELVDAWKTLKDIEVEISKRTNLNNLNSIVDYKIASNKNFEEIYIEIKRTKGKWETWKSNYDNYVKFEIPKGYSFKQSMDFIGQKIVNSEIEILYCLDDEGKVIYKVMGDAESCDIPDNAANLHLVHNHPSYAYVSILAVNGKSDFKSLIIKNASSVTAYSKNNLKSTIVNHNFTIDMYNSFYQNNYDDIRSKAIDLFRPLEGDEFDFKVSEYFYNETNKIFNFEK